jgi:hypothetical protein
VLSNIGHFVKYFGVLSANYLRSFPDFSHPEYFTKITPINNTYWSALNTSVYLEEVLKILKIISGSLPDPDLFKQAKTRPKYLMRLSL